MLAMLEHLAEPKVFVQNARKVSIKTPKVQQNVLNVRWESCTSIPKQRAVVVTLVRLAKPKVFVQNARRVSTKTPKAKQSAVTPATRQKKHPTLTVPGVNCHRGVPAKWANI